MAFDGTVIHALADELNTNISGGRISKIYQPEKDEILLIIRGLADDRKLLLSANPALPLVCFIEENKQNQATAPAFCMLLRKHILNGKILSVQQVGFERAIKIEIEHINEMGDMGKKYLIIEIMGKHSNIIIINEDNIILDGIKRITPEISSVRCVLPNEPYFIPNSNQKLNPLDNDANVCIDHIRFHSLDIHRAIIDTISGFSPMIADEICFTANIDGDKTYSELTDQEKTALSETLGAFICKLKQSEFTPSIYYNNDQPKDFAVFKPNIYKTLKCHEMQSVNEMLLSYYYEKAKHDRLKQKSADLRQLINNLLAKNTNKLKLQEKQLSDTQKKDKYKLYGELINAYLYDIKEGASTYNALNYYDNSTVKISLDPSLPASKNAVKYFDRYTKLKRTFEALNELIPETKRQIEYLQSISMYLSKLTKEEEIAALKDDLIANGFIKSKNIFKKNKDKRNNKLGVLHYKTKTGRDIFVGRNNLQNEELTFKLSDKNDWWFHAKSVAGSHVIMKTNKDDDIADSDFEDAARLAAYYSSADSNSKIEVDYTLRKNLIKPPASLSGYVIYHTNYSMNIDNDISKINLIE